MPRFCEVYPGICLTTGEKAWKNLSQGSRRVPVGTMDSAWNLIYIMSVMLQFYIYCFIKVINLIILIFLCILIPDIVIPGLMYWLLYCLVPEITWWWCFAAKMCKSYLKLTVCNQTVCIFWWMTLNIFFSPSNATTCSYELRGFPSWLWLQCSQTSEVGMPMRHGYVVPMKWVVICVCEDEVPGWALKSKSTNYPDMFTMGIFPYQEKSPWENRESNPGPHG